MLRNPGLSSFAHNVAGQTGGSSLIFRSPSGRRETDNRLNQNAQKITKFPGVPEVRAM